MTDINYRTAKVDGRNVFYREAGAPNAPKLLLLHGFPSLEPHVPGPHPAPGRPLSHRRSRPAGLRPHGDAGAGRVRLHVRQSRPGRWSASPSSSASTDSRVYVFDYGAPTGFRIAMQAPGTDHRDHLPERQRLRGRPERRLESHPCVLAGAVAGQPGGAPRIPDAGGDALAVYPRRARRDAPSPPTAIRSTTSTSTRPGADEIQLDLFRDYASNVALYPAFQDYFRKHRPRFLAVWGKNDPFFLPAGAEAFKRDIPEADVRFFETGHFALETHAEPIAAAIREFLPE